MVVYTVSDVWREAQRRWMVAGVLSAVALAVLSPRLGAVGGALHAEVVSYLPLCYVYYAAGRRARVGALWAGMRGGARAHAACVAHAHVVAPALAAALLTALPHGLDYRIVKGVMVWSRGGGCAWLSLALSSHAAAPSAAALVYLATLPVAPLATKLICGSAWGPAPASVALTVATSLGPFAAGLLRPVAAGAGRPTRALRLAALALLYAECCERLADSESILHVSDVLLTLTLVALGVCGVAATSALYARCGVLSAADARLVTLVALPRCLDTRGDTCVPAGLVRLPGVFLAPAQALLLAALVPDDPAAEAAAAWCA